MTTKHYFIKTVFILVALFLVSCSGYKKLPYLKDAESLTKEQLLASATLYEAKIMPKDILSITVNSSIPGAAADFNLPLLASGSTAVKQTSGSSSQNGLAGTLQTYIVDNKGKIDFPILGELSIGGLTKSQAEDLIAEQIYPKYLKEKPIVNIRMLNFKVSVLGEVARPGSYSTDNEQMTLFDALAQAGDLTIYGRRDNVMLLRTKANGELVVHKINLQDKDLLLYEDLYYLQQNDKIIVQVNKAKGNSSSFGTMESVGISLLSVLISVVAIVTR